MALPAGASTSTRKWPRSNCQSTRIGCATSCPSSTRAATAIRPIRTRPGSIPCSIGHFFIGGPFSFFSHQGFNLAGTAVNFKQRDSLVIDFRTSKSEGQANFVNPGALIFGYGLDADVLPKLKTFVNVNYVRTVTTETTELVLFTNHANNDFALDCKAGFEWRPLLTDNIILSAGCGFLVPRIGYKDIYRTNTVPVHGYPQPAAGSVDPFLYSAIVTLTLTY